MGQGWHVPQRRVFGTALDARHKDQVVLAKNPDYELHIQMENIDDVIAKVLDQLPLNENRFPPNCKFWLTVYLDGSESASAIARPQLGALGWSNLGDETEWSGFIYAKKEVLNMPDQIRDALVEILSVCEKSGMDFSLIDADTTFDPSITKFQNLYKPPSIIK